MEEASDVIRSVARWIAPVTGLILMFIARRRFRLRGTTYAVVGFGLVVLILAVRRILVPLLLDQRVYSANELGQQLAVLGAASAIGLVLAVVALRKMIAAVALTAAGDSMEPDDQ